MDPVANIERQREIVARLLEVKETPAAGRMVALAADCCTLAWELAELVQALDEWRVNGGFDPYGDLTGVDNRDPDDYHEMEGLR